MASHVELNPDDNVLGLSLGMKAMRLALTQKTHKVGTVRIPTGGDTDVIIGDGAQDGANRIDRDGNQLPLVDTSGIDKAAQDARKAADDAAAKADEAIKQGEQIRQDAQAGIDDARKQAQAADTKADKVRTDLTKQVQNVKSEMDSAVEAAQTSANKAQSAADAAQKAADKANASTIDLDKSIKAVDAKAIAAKQAAAEAQSKAENVASDLDSANAVIEQHTTELGELTTKVSNAVKKSDSALNVSTEAKQTATEASTTASSAYKDSQTALTQSTTATQTATAAKTTAESAGKTANDSLKQSSAAVQTANQISTTLRTEYQTKADADKIYATQSSLKQTSDSITASVSKTYATKDALSALQNVADNAIESWRGTGIPTLTNKPASDWTTDAKRKKHSGDLYYDKATGKAYRFGSDDGKTYTWELNQDTDVTKALADAAKAQTSANNAQASATAANTAAGKAQSTANTAVSNAATAKNAADAAQSSANKAQGDVDKLKIDIPETYATKSSLSQTAESITANVESVKTTANSAVTAASKAQQTADGISVNLTKNYQTKSQADTIYATKASLKATSDSISAEVTKAQGTADGAVTAASKAQQTADAVTLNLSKNYQTKVQNDAVYATKTSLKATSDSLTASINSTAKTAQSSVDKATNLEANLNGFKTTVSQTYTTKTEFANLSIGGTNRIVLSGGVAGRIDMSGDSGSIDTGTHWTSAYVSVAKAAYVLSSDIKVEGNTYVSVAFYDMDKKFISRPTGAMTNLAAPWSRILTVPTNAAYMRASFPTNQKGHIKLEKGTKPTDWSPAPEDLQPAGDYATNSSLTQTANSIKAQVTEVSKTANGAMSKATTVEQTANGLSSKITEQGKTLNATVKTANEAKSTADSNKTTISQVSTTASNALSKASTVEQNLNGFKTTVSQTYTTKTDFNNLTVGGRNLLLKTSVPTVITGSEAWNQCVAHYSLAVGSLKNLPVGMYHMQFKIKSDTAGGTAYAQWNAEPWGLGSITKVNIGTTEQTYSVDYYIADNNYPDANQMSVRLDNAKGKVTIREMKLEKGTKPTDWSPAPEDLQPTGDYATNSSLTQTANQIRGEVSEKYQSKSGMSSYATTSALTQKANEITGKVTEVAKTATGAMGKASSVEQTASALSSKLSETVRTLDSTVQTVNTVKSTADSNRATLTQVAKTASDASSRASSVEQNLNGFKTTVSQTYTTKTDTQNLRQMSALTYQLTGSGGKAKWVKIGYLVSNGDSTSILLHVYSGNGYNGDPGQNAEFEIYIKDGNNGTQGAANAFGVSITKIRNADNVKVKVLAFNATSCDVWAYMPWDWWDGRYTIQGSYHTWRSYPDNSNSTSETEPTSGTAQPLAYDSLSTKSYVDQTAKSVALGVVQNYKGADGSGLATKSDITVAKDSITSTVAKTYATKSGVTQEISSKITQNNNSLDVKFSTKVETQNAQNKANTADSHATDAQSRVGSLEDCINFTASGVRVGKRSNGKFTGVSALVNTNGTFDLLDASGNLLTRINRHRFQVTGDDGTGSGYLSLSQDGINITVQPTADTSKTYHFQVGKSGVGITAPDGARIECSTSGGLNIETVKFGKIAIGSGGLQFTNDQGWGLKLSAAGWSIKWAGNHTLATGPKAGALYIDGHEIVTR
ncbi:hypothetical protein ACW9VV_04600 [Bifidobacterium adolescentis]